MKTLKERHSRIALSHLCCLFGMTRQAYYQHWEKTAELTLEQDLVLEQVLLLRQKHSRMGVRKLHILLETFLMEHQSRWDEMPCLVY